MNQLSRFDARYQRAAILGLGLLCVALVVHEIFGPHGYLALRREQRNYLELQQKIEMLKQENQQLESQIKSLKTDPHAIEKMAREQMGLARPGEIIITLPDKDKKKDAAVNPKDSQPK